VALFFGRIRSAWKLSVSDFSGCFFVEMCRIPDNYPVLSDVFVLSDIRTDNDSNLARFRIITKLQLYLFIFSLLLSTQ